MSILNRARQRNPKMGFATGWVSDVIKPLCKEIKDKKIKLVTNSGGLNPLGCKEALLQVAAAAGVEFKIGVVLGDDQYSRSEEFRERGVTEMHLGSPMPEQVATTYSKCHCHCGLTNITASSVFCLFPFTGFDSLHQRLPWRQAHRAGPRGGMRHRHHRS